MRKNYFLILLLIYVSLSSCEEFVDSSIKNYKSEKFNFELEKPFVFRENKTLYFSNGKSDEIYQNKIYSLKDKPKYHERNIFVSPNSKWIVIKDNAKLILIDKKGKKKLILGESKVNSRYNFEKDKFRWQNIQFSSDSHYILLVKDESRNINGNILNGIYLFDLESQELKFIYKAEKMLEINFSRTNRSIYYEYFASPNYKEVIEIDIYSPNNEKVSTNFNDSLLFRNFDVRDINNFTSDLKLQVVDKFTMDTSDYYMKEGIYFISENKKTLMMESTLADKNFKGIRFSNHHSNKSYFLPGNRYYNFHNCSKEYNGFLIYDTQKMKYQEFGENIDFYYSLTSYDVSNKVSFRYKINERMLRK